MAPFVRLRLLFLVFCTLAGVHTIGQTFFKMYNRGNSGFAVREVPGGHVVAGGTDFYTNWHWFTMSQPATTDIHLFKTDLNGTLLWERVIGTPLSRTIARSMEPASDGGYIIAGHDSRDKMWPPDSNDVVLVKTDAMGNPAWARVFDTGKDEIAHSVQQTSDGGYIVSGFHDSAPMSAAGTTNILLIKTDATGLTQWAEKIPLAIRDFITNEPFTYVVRQTADMGYVIVGTGVGAYALGVYVVRTDPLGAVLWAKLYEHDVTALRYSTGLDIMEHTNGDFLIAGSMDKSQPMETNYPYVLRISSTGTLLTAKFFETVPALFFQSGFSSVRPIPGGGFFLCGMGGYGEFGDQAQMLKTDENLNTIWSRVYTWDGVATMGARNGRPTTDGGYVFTGKRQFAGTVLMKTNPLGLIPCKTPNVLGPLAPSVVVQDRFPVPQALSIGAPILFNTGTPLVDSTTVCPVTQITLPIELSSFIAMVEATDRVRLDWTTLSERNNDHFLMERSRDGQDFEAIGRVLGAGTSAQEVRYTFTDHDPDAGSLNYYRLTQVDMDGTSTRSDIITAAFPRTTALFSDARVLVHGDNASILFGMDQARKVHLRIIDMTGRSHLELTRDLTSGPQRITFPTTVLPEGMYLYALSTTKGMASGRFLR